MHVVRTDTSRQNTYTQKIKRGIFQSGGSVYTPTRLWALLAASVEVLAKNYSHVPIF